MSELTAAAKGCVIQATSKDLGYYRIQGLSSPGPVFVQQVAPNRTDITAPKACFDNNHRFYVFGKGFGDITITIEAFLGNRADTGVEASINSFFDANRASASSSPVTVTARNGGSHSFFLIGIRVVGTNPSNNMIRFQLFGKIVE